MTQQRPRPTPASDVDPGSFREIMSRYATGVTIVTARDRDGTPQGVTMSSFNSVSLDPPLVLFSLGLQLRSIDCFRQAKSYAINLLSADQADLAQRFGRPSPEKWLETAWSESPCGAPLLPDTIACLICRPFARYPGGDHEIFVLEVDRIMTGDCTDPLVFHAGALRALDTPA